MWVARPGDERPELEGTEAKAEGEEGDLGLRGPGEGAREEKTARRGPRPLAVLAPSLGGSLEKVAKKGAEQAGGVALAWV